MGRISLFAAALVVVLLGVLMLGASPGAIAQDATPASDEMGFEGITFEPVAFAPGITAPVPTDIILVRIGLEPGAVLPSLETDPDGVLAYVESGTLTLQLETPLTVSRAGSFMAAIATAEAGGDFVPPIEEFASGEEITLEVGDVVFVPAHVAGELRNVGQERAVVLGVIFATPESAFAEATPES